MLFDIFVKLYVTPENIFALLWTVVTIVGMCLIFHAWEERWWKSLIPFYGTYLMYRHAWKKYKWLFFVQTAFDITGMLGSSFMRKHITSNLFDAIKTYIQTESIDIDISISYLLGCAAVLLLSMIVVFLLTRITYVKICESLGIQSVLLKIGTFFLPQIFLVIDYVYVKKKAAKSGSKENLAGGRHKML